MQTIKKLASTLYNCRLWELKVGDRVRFEQEIPFSRKEPTRIICWVETTIIKIRQKELSRFEIVGIKNLITPKSGKIRSIFAEKEVKYLLPYNDVLPVIQTFSPRKSAKRSFSI